MKRLLQILLIVTFIGFSWLGMQVVHETGHVLVARLTGVMTENGSPVWVFLLFGLLAAPLGLYLWHRQGPHFGLGAAKGSVSMQAAVTSAALFLALVAGELIRNER